MQCITRRRNYSHLSVCLSLSYLTALQRQRRPLLKVITVELSALWVVSVRVRHGRCDTAHPSPPGPARGTPAARWMYALSCRVKRTNVVRVSDWVTSCVLVGPSKCASACICACVDDESQHTRSTSSFLTSKTDPERRLCCVHGQPRSQSKIHLESGVVTWQQWFLLIQTRIDYAPCWLRNIGQGRKGSP